MSTDREFGELTKLLREANPLIFDGLTVGCSLEDMIDFEAERVEMMSNPPGDPPVTADEYRRAGRRALERFRAQMTRPPSGEREGGS